VIATLVLVKYVTEAGNTSYRGWQWEYRGIR